MVEVIEQNYNGPQIVSRGFIAWLSIFYPRNAYDKNEPLIRVKTLRDIFTNIVKCN